MKMTDQIYNSIAKGFDKGEKTVPVKTGNKTTYYKVAYSIMSQTWGGATAQFSSATVTWTSGGKNHSAILTSTDEKEMKQALANFGVVLAQLNTDVWKDFLSCYVSDAFGLAGIKVTKNKADQCLDTAEKVILALDNKEAAKELIEETGDALTSEAKKKLTDEFEKFARENVPNSDLIFDAVDAYKKVKSTYEKWEKQFNANSESDKLTRLYQNFESALTDLDDILSDLSK